jgi:hypothetical protein
MRKRRLFLTGIFSSIFTSYSVLADSSSVSSWFPYLPRLSGTGWVSNNQDILQGDAMAALFGNPQNILWLDAQAKNALDSSWSVDPGVGYRYVYNDERIFGAYLFADSSRALNGGHTFWDLSPGLESMGRLWDFRINGYFPYNRRRVFISQGFADEYDQYQFVTFAGRTEYDKILTLYQQIGNGVDGEIGRWIVPGLTAYVGAYYFSAGPSTSGLVNPQNIKGFAARAQYEFNPRLALEINDTYDNVLHDTILGGVRFTLGGLGNSAQDRSDISSRLLDSVERSLATQGQGVAVPVQNQLQLTQLNSSNAAERSNIWFFNPGGSPSYGGGDVTINANSCTFENPCSPAAFTQDNINAINGFAPGANFYLATATYTIGTSTGTPTAMTLNADQSIFGREPGFAMPATGSDRPILEGGLIIPSDTTATIDSIQLLNLTANPYAGPGMTINNNDNLTISDSVIGQLSANNYQNFTTAIAITGSDNTVKINNSDVYAFSPGISPAQGIAISGPGNNAELQFGSNDIITAVVSSSTSGNNYAFGIIDTSSGNNHLFFSSNDTINAEASNSSAKTYSSGINVATSNDAFNFGNTDTITASSSDSLKFHFNYARGINLNQSHGNNTFTFGDDNTISASTYKGYANIAVAISKAYAPAGHDTFIFGANDHINVNLTGGGNLGIFPQYGMGIRVLTTTVNPGNATFTFANNDQVNVSNSNSGLLVVAWGLNNYGNLSNTNTWNNVSDITFNVTAPSGTAINCSGVSGC